MKKTILILAIGALMLTACNQPADLPTPSTPPAEEALGSCDKACDNYALCAGYGDDMTAQDVDDAFASCMEECAGWEKTNIDCMAKVIVRNPEDCGPVSLCGLKNYQGIMQ